MEIAYMFLLAPAVLWVAIIVIKTFLYLNDPLRDLGARSRSARNQSAAR